jgi:hypothetical protein
VTQHEIERAVRERQRRGVAGDSSNVEPEPRSVALEGREHPGGDVGADGLADHPREHQVEREVARAGADLERAPVRPGPCAEQLAELA